MSLLEITQEERVLRIALNRPEKKNALSTELCGALTEALEAADADPGIGAILLEARGDIFCAGMDLLEAAGSSAASKTALHERLFTMGSRLATPLVAAVHGPAIGGGVGLVANAHIALAAQGCHFGLTEIRVGMWPFIIWRAVVNAIGERRATALALTGRIFGANEALQWGLIHELTPPFELDERATATAHHLANSSPEAIRLGLGYLREARGLPLTESGELALAYRTQAFASDDFKEGVAAFLENRRPVWSTQWSDGGSSKP